jgi:hypothetical protein
MNFGHMLFLCDTIEDNLIKSDKKYNIHIVKAFNYYKI